MGYFRQIHRYTWTGVSRRDVLNGIHRYFAHSGLRGVERDEGTEAACDGPSWPKDDRRYTIQGEPL